MTVMLLIVIVLLLCCPGIILLPLLFLGSLIVWICAAIRRFFLRT